jgi:hypothetical protein
VTIFDLVKLLETPKQLFKPLLVFRQTRMQIYETLGKSVLSYSKMIGVSRNEFHEDAKTIKAMITTDSANIRNYATVVQEKF